MDNSPIPAKASLSRAMQHLAQGEQEADKALGALTIALMCEEGNIPADTETLDRLRACLFDALNGGSDQVKVNVLLAISALTNLCENFISGLTSEHVCILLHILPKGIDDLTTPDVTKIAVNGMGCIAAFARSQDTPDSSKTVAQALGEHHALEIALPFVHSSQSTVRAAACEAMCAFVSNSSVDFKASAVDKGVATSLMEALTAYATTNDHTHANVLSLLCIGMILQMDEAAQQSISSSPENIATLLAYMRQHDDGDVQVLATEIFGVLTKTRKDNIAQSMRHAQKAMDARLKYTV